MLEQIAINVRANSLSGRSYSAFDLVWDPMGAHLAGDAELDRWDFFMKTRKETGIGKKERYERKDLLPAHSFLIFVCFGSILVPQLDPSPTMSILLLPFKVFLIALDFLVS